MKLSDLKPARYNPRKITDEALSGLGTSLEQFGDLSGITFNSRTGNLVCGHQRVKALTLTHGDLPISDGWIDTPDGERFRVRIVDWDETTEKAANVAANSHLIAGEFTEDLSDILEELRDEIPDLCENLRFDELEADLFEVPKSGNRGDGGNDQPGNYFPGEKWAVLIEVSNEDEQRELLERFIEEGLRCRGLIL